MDLIAAFRVFIRVAESGSFSAVARETTLSQPAISRQIAALEDHVGARLFHRTTRSLTLTDDGQDLLIHAKRVLDALAEAEQAVGHRRGRVAGQVRLSVPATWGRLQLAPRLGKLLAAYPDLSIDLLLNDAPADLVAEGIDLALRAGEITDGSLVARRISSVSRYVVASTAYLAAHGTPQKPQDLVAHQCLIFSRAVSPQIWHFTGPEGELEIAVGGRLRSDSGEAIREAVIDGYGIALLPDWYFRDEIKSGQVRLLLENWQNPPTPVYAIYPSRRHLSPRVRALLDFLIAEFGVNGVAHK
jgi:DNA-binding transcriptional LysR family regulator